MALPCLPAEGQVLVLYGDVPLVTVDTLRTLVERAGESLSLLTDTPADPAGYGRVVRQPDGTVRAIVEEKDASPGQKAIREINTGMMVLPASRLAGWLAALDNRNAQGEYYLTDVIGLAVADGLAVTAVPVEQSWQAAGINSKRQLAELERIYQRNEAGRLLDQGVTLLDPARFDLRGELHCGRDVSIDVGCVFEGRVELGDGVEIGAHCVLRNVTLDAGTAWHLSVIWTVPGSAVMAASVRSPGCGQAPSWPNRCTSATLSRSRTASWGPAARPTI